MKTIAHRGLWDKIHQPNSLSSFDEAFRRGFAIETDLRSFQNEIVVSHDPVTRDEALLASRMFELASQFNPMLFLNIKEDGLIPGLKDLMGRFRNVRCVFFDMSAPEQVRYTNTFPKENCATRYSDVERFPLFLERSGWIWADCFSRDLDAEDLSYLSMLRNHEVIFVSPQLHRRDPDPFVTLLRTRFFELYEKSWFCTDHAVNENSKGKP